MKEKIEARINELMNQEQRLIQEIGQLEKTATNKRATLVSVRGGIIERQLMLKEIDIVEEEE